MRSVLVKWAFALYQGLLSPLLHLLFGPGYGCRFQPTCSAYSREALQQHGWVKGSALTVGRLCRCHPFSTGGFDPVPQYDIASSRKVRANGS